MKTGNRTFDVIVVGLGAMGSAAAYHLSRRGCRVLGLERFTPPHTFGSSHGQTRIIREAYFEHPAYVPLVQRAYTLWAELEQATGRPLFRQTGGLMIGPPDGLLVTGAQRSAEMHRLSYAVLPATEVRRRFPAFRPPDEMVAVWEPRAGVLFPEACIEAHLEMARWHGAVLQFETPVSTWTADGDGVAVITPRGTYRAGQLLLTAGAWLGHLMPDLALPLTVERQTLFWFHPAAHPDHFRPDRCPIYIWEYEPSRFFYGFPDLGAGIKVGRHHEGETVDPENMRREIAPEEAEAMRRLLKAFMPDAAGALRSAAVCLYTNTPDFHFLIDFHPHDHRILIASPCSGHGFKFSSAVGEILADLLTGTSLSFDLSLFRMDRLKR